VVGRDRRARRSWPVCGDSFRDNPIVAHELKSALIDFVRFAQTLRGDEKSEAQTFLDHFFRALGHDGVIEAGATFEFRVAKKPGSPQLELIKGNGAPARTKARKKFADLLWPDRVLIEMKSRGEKLERYYDQAFDYWSHIIPQRPPFVILCNFDEFWIYDFNTQLFDPVDRVVLNELPENAASFNFLLSIWKKPVFSNNRVEVTRKAADEMATVFREIVARGEDRQRAQRFILQLLVAMVAEDIGLLPLKWSRRFCSNVHRKARAHTDLIGGLFRQMATENPARGGRFQNVQYFNGGSFEVVDPIELKRPESYRLHEAARYNDWSKVRPEIFGTLFQDSMDKTFCACAKSANASQTGKREKTSNVSGEIISAHSRKILNQSAANLKKGLASTPIPVRHWSRLENVERKSATVAAVVNPECFGDSPETKLSLMVDPESVRG